MFSILIFKVANFCIHLLKIVFHLRNVFASCGAVSLNLFNRLPFLCDCTVLTLNFLSVSLDFRLHGPNMTDLALNLIVCNVAGFSQLGNPAVLVLL